MFQFNQTIIRPNTRHNIGTFSESLPALAECTSTVSCIWPDDGSIELKHVAEFLILITNICCVID